MCNHKNIVTESSGGQHLVGGEYWDDYTERYYCLDCNTYLSDEVQPAFAWIEDEFTWIEDELVN